MQQTAGFDATAVAIKYLTSTRCPQTQWRVTSQYTSHPSEVTHVYLVQTFAGRDVANRQASPLPPFPCPSLLAIHEPS